MFTCFKRLRLAAHQTTSAVSNKKTSYPNDSSVVNHFCENQKKVVTNICWPIHASAATFAPLAIKNGWWSSVSGSAARCSSWSPTGNNLKVRNWVFSIPKRLRIYFLFNRKLLAKLSRCAWKVLSAYLKPSVPFMVFG
jgi:hypothetical protein